MNKKDFESRIREIVQRLSDVAELVNQTFEARLTFDNRMYYGETLAIVTMLNAFGCEAVMDATTIGDYVNINSINIKGVKF